MNYTIKIFTVIMFLSLLWSGCSSSLPEVKEIQEKSDQIYDGLRINTKEIYSWVNKMPGQKPRFHVTGKLQIFEDSKYSLNDLTIEDIIVKQNSETIYQFNPTVKIEYLENYKSIVFSTVRGLLFSSIIDVNKNITISFNLTNGIKKFVYTVEDVSIEEVF